MVTKFTTSVNIIRDSESDLNYIPTPNAIRIVNQISNDFKKGRRSFNIIGSYGTGKSAFLWAFQQSAIKRKKYFGINLLPNAAIDFINIVGEYRSLRENFAELLEIKNSKNIADNIFSELFNRYHDLGDKNKVLFLLIDEFGKFLEFASKNKPEEELYFIQQLAEFINNPEINIVLFTTVHQNFDAYAINLNQSQKQEWTKVKGRFTEITFNEPVEQLLFLASEHLNEKPSTKKSEREIRKSIDLLLKSKAFNVNEDYINEIAEKLFPLDSVAAYVLTLSLQKYGQNERSLFSFLESTDHTGLYQHASLGKGFYTIAEVYEYLIFNYYSFLNSKYNPDFSAWKSIKSSLEKVESDVEGNIIEHAKIVKTIGLLNITSLGGSVLDKKFLENYAENCLGIKNPGDLIDVLVKKQVILYRNYSKRFVLFEGTDLDIQTALIEAGGKIDDITDVVTLLNKYYQLPPIIAKNVMYETGTPRLFEYKITTDPINDLPVGEIDGFINLIFNEKLNAKTIKEFSAVCGEAILFGYYKNAKSIKELLFEIEKTKRVINQNADDKVAVRELNNIVLHQQNLLSHKILNNFQGNSTDVVWYFKGQEVIIKTKKDLNSKLSEICKTIYNHTPIFNNELVNKHKISSSIHSAKRNYFKALINNWDKPQLGFAETKFPPEKTIYLTLLENNNIKLFADEILKEQKPTTENGFSELWNISIQYLNSAKASKRSVSDFIDLLRQKPFKLKQGFIDFWVPSVLFIKRDDYALFSNGVYIPDLTDELLDLMGKNPEEYEIKSFAIEGVKLNIFNSYRLFLNQTSKEKVSNKSFIETIKPFLTFYKDLPEYSKNTNRISVAAKKLRNAISNSKDPEKTFFEDFPLALGFTMNKIQSSSNNLQEYSIELKDAIKEIRNSYEELINRTELFIQEEIIGELIPFEEYKELLQKRFLKLRRHLLLPVQRIFVQRLDSKIDDKKAWLNSLVQALQGKTLEKISDEEEIVIADKFKSMILDLDSLTMLSNSDFKEDEEYVFDLQINSFFDGMKKRLVRLPKNKKEAVDNIQTKLKKGLSNDISLNIAALTDLLKEILKNE